ncbi:MAG TPA: caspase family protein [Polyangiaceae bacterium]|nr:caspase family protein [Polyangiaceae bacterium]
MQRRRWAPVFRATVGFVLALIFGVVPALAHAEPATFTISIGNNAPPSSEARAGELRYADDDAVRYADLFARLGPVWLLSKLDAKTARRHPSWQSKSQAPTLAHLRQAVKQVAAQVAQAKKRGETAQVLLTFSGHGALSERGEYFLSLSDGQLTRAMLYDEVLEPLRQARVHLIVDACHAGGVVGVRGAFDHEVDAKTQAVNGDDRQALVGRYSLERFPNVGALIASTPGQEAHEWSRIEAGVFTYEVTSALLGAADLNRDLRIEYGEVAAFVATANQSLEDPDAAPQLLARAPRDGALLLDLTQLSQSLVLTGRADKLGRFYIELGDGQRWLEAHVPPNARVTLALPLRGGSFVRAGGMEAEIPLTPGGVVRIESLHFVPNQLAARGSVARALERDLFASPFDRDNYRRFAAQSDLPPVAFGAPRPLPPRFTLVPDAPRRNKALPIALTTGAGAAAITAAISGYLSYNAYQQFHAEDRQRQATELRSDVVTYRNVALASTAVALAAGAGAYFTW